MKLKLALLFILLIAVAQARRIDFLGHHKEDETEKKTKKEGHRNSGKKHDSAPIWTESDPVWTETPGDDGGEGQNQGSQGGWRWDDWGKYEGDGQNGWVEGDNGDIWGEGGNNGGEGQNNGGEGQGNNGGEGQNDGGEGQNDGGEGQGNNGGEGQNNGEESQGNNGGEGQNNGEEGQGNNGGEENGQSGQGNEGSDNNGSCSNGGNSDGSDGSDGSNSGGETWQEQQTCKGVIFDAGSSGTRVFVYSWPCRLFHYANPEIEITQNAPSVKVNPGISSFGDNISGLREYFQPLLDFANEHVEENIRNRTPILLGATAGMRILGWSQQYDVMEEVRSILRESGYLFQTSDWARILSGKDEGAYLWLSVNYLKGFFSSSNLDDQGKLVESYTTIDIGGASTQLADDITEQDQYYLTYDDEYETDYHTFETSIYNISLYSHSWLYFGQDQARIQINNFLHNLHRRSSSFENPCYLKGYKDKYDDNIEIIGSGNPNDCKDLIDLYLLGFNSTCDQCSIQESYIPTIRSDSKVYAAGAANFVSKIFNDDNDYTWTQFEFFDEFCSKEFDENNDGKYYDTQCFLGLYVQELLASGYRIPSDTLIETGKIQDIEPSWTLAAMFDQIDDNEPCSDSPQCNMRRHMKQWRKDSFHPSMKEHKGQAPFSDLMP